MMVNVGKYTIHGSYGTAICWNPEHHRWTKPSMTGPGDNHFRKRFQGVYKLYNCPTFSQNLHPWKLTRQRKIPMFNRKYIFIHGGFSIVMLVFRGGVKTNNKSSKPCTFRDPSDATKSKFLGLLSWVLLGGATFCSGNVWVFSTTKH